MNIINRNFGTIVILNIIQLISPQAVSNNKTTGKNQIVLISLPPFNLSTYRPERLMFTYIQLKIESLFSNRIKVLLVSIKFHLNLWKDIVNALKFQSEAHLSYWYYRFLEKKGVCKKSFTVNGFTIFWRIWEVLEVRRKSSSVKFDFLDKF